MPERVALPRVRRGAQLSVINVLTFLEAVMAGEDIAGYYGTYDDTSPSRQDGIGVERTLLVPNDAIKLLLVGSDSSGTALSGDLSVSNVVFEADTTAQTMAVAFAGIVHESSGDTMEFDFNLSLEGEIDPEGDITDMEVNLAASGSVCALSYALFLEIDGQSNIAVSGHYQEDGNKVSFEVTANTTPPDTTTSMTIWVGPDSRPTVLVQMVANTSNENCVSGKIEVNGQKQADLVATGCGTEEMQVYAVVQGEQVPVEDVFDELNELLEELGLLDIELPFGSFSAAALGSSGPIGFIGRPSEWQTSAGN